LVWLLILVARSPKNVPLRAITLLIVTWAVSYPFGVSADSGHGIFGLDPLMSQMIAGVLQLFGMYFLVLFFLFTIYEAAQARRRAWQQLPVAVAVAVGLAASALATPPEDRPAAARVITDALAAHYASSVPSIGAFYFLSNVYSLYACAFALLVTCRYARQGPDRRLRQGMIVVAAGLSLLVLALGIFVLANIFLWAGHSADLPSIIVVIGTFASFIGIVVFVIGLAYRSVTMRLAAARVWWQHLRAYHQLRPLWTALHEEFPEDILDRAPATAWRDVLSVRGVHRRYYRRVIECRDGLVRLSPYLADSLPDDPNGGGAGALAPQIRQALRAHAAGAAVLTEPVLVAAPAEQGLDADVAQLVGLARALRA
jgi:hypothetical protein